MLILFCVNVSQIPKGNIEEERRKGRGKGKEERNREERKEGKELESQIRTVITLSTRLCDNDGGQLWGFRPVNREILRIDYPSLSLRDTENNRNRRSVSRKMAKMKG